MIVDNEGNLVYYAPAPGESLYHDFRKLSNGTLTYFDSSKGMFMVLDSAYQIIDQWAAGNGYTTDLHELRVLPNGHAILMSYDPRPVDMSQVIAGGQKDAIVNGLVLPGIGPKQECSSLSGGVGTIFHF